MAAPLRSLRSVQVSASFNTSLRSLRSVPLSVSVVSGQALFKIFRGYEGNQIVANWNIPDTGIVRYRLVRRLDAWPENIDNGVNLIEESAPFSTLVYSDRQIESYRVYYYWLFLERADGVWIADRKMRGKLFGYPTGYFEEKLWYLLPTVYHVVDGEA